MVLACALFPGIVRAAVTINEIAWMGTAASANDEWIELRNDGAEDVAVSGWTLTASDGEPKITLSGSIGWNGFFLLERTDDESASGVPADLIYSGNLANTGETLVLKDGSGAVIDTVAGGTNWQNVGGDNTTKHTAQRQDDGTWITGVPTAGAVNSTENTKTEGVPGGTASTTAKTTNPMAPKVSGGYRQKVFAFAGLDEVNVVGADVRFEGWGVDDKNKELYHPVMDWAFGDGTRGRGEQVLHTYRQPGVYTVVLRVSFEGQRAEDTKTVEIIEPKARIGDAVAGESGFVEIVNDAEYELDIAKWFLQARRGDNDRRLKSFVFPENTRIAPHTKVRFPELVTNLNFSAGDKISLLFPDKVEVALAFAETESVSVPGAGEEKTEYDTNEIILPPPRAEAPETAVAEPETSAATSAPKQLEEPVTLATTSAIVLGAAGVPKSGGSRTALGVIIGVCCAVLLGTLLWHRKKISEVSGLTLSADGELVRPEDMTIIDTTPKER